MNEKECSRYQPVVGIMNLDKKRPRGIIREQAVGEQKIHGKRELVEKCPSDAAKFSRKGCRGEGTGSYHRPAKVLL